MAMPLLESKDSKAKKYVIILLSFIIVILILHMLSSGSGWFAWIMGFGLLGGAAYYIISSNKKNKSLNLNEVVDHIADQEYGKTGRYLDTDLFNVTASRSTLGEMYVQFHKENITYLYQSGTGIIERYLGKSIERIMEARNNDNIAYMIAEKGIEASYNRQKLEQMGYIPPENEPESQNYDEQQVQQ